MIGKWLEESDAKSVRELEQTIEKWRKNWNRELFVTEGERIFYIQIFDSF